MDAPAPGRRSALASILLVAGCSASNVPVQREAALGAGCSSVGDVGTGWHFLLQTPSGLGPCQIEEGRAWSGGPRSLEVWREKTSIASVAVIRTAMILGDGQVLDLGAQVQTNLDPGPPWLTWDGRRWLMVWSEAANSGPRQTRLAWLDAFGQPTGTVTLATDGREPSGVATVQDVGAFSWSRGDQPGLGLIGNGTVTDVLPPTPAGPFGPYGVGTALGREPDRFFLVWATGRTLVGEHVLPGGGVVEPAPIVLDAPPDGGVELPSLASGPRGHGIAAARWAANFLQEVAAVVDFSGELAPTGWAPLPGTVGVGVPVGASLMGRVISQGEDFLVLLDRDPYQNPIQWIPLHSDGRLGTAQQSWPFFLTEANRLLVPEVYAPGIPDAVVSSAIVAGERDGGFAAWTLRLGSTSLVEVLRLAADAAANGVPTSFGRGRVPRLASGRSGYLLVSEAPGDGGVPDVVWRLLPADGQLPLTAANLEPPPETFRARPRVAVGQDSFLVAWQEARADGGFAIGATRVSSAGGQLDFPPLRFEGAGGDVVFPDVAASPDGTQGLVAWEQLNPDGGSFIEGRWMDLRTGQIAPAPLVLAPGGGNLAPAAAGLGADRFVVAWVNEGTRGSGTLQAADLDARQDPTSVAPVGADAGAWDIEVISGQGRGLLQWNARGDFMQVRLVRATASGLVLQPTGLSDGYYPRGFSLPTAPGEPLWVLGSSTACNAATVSASRLDVVPFAQGRACGCDGDCVSGHCSDGVCCDSACTDQCHACTVAKGAPVDGLCSPRTGTPCQSGQTCSSGDTCQQGVCVAGAACRAPDGGSSSSGGSGSNGCSTPGGSVAPVTILALLASWLLPVARRRVPVGEGAQTSRSAAP